MHINDIPQIFGPTVTATTLPSLHPVEPPSRPPCPPRVPCCYVSRELHSFWPWTGPLPPECGQHDQAASEPWDCAAWLSAGRSAGIRGGWLTLVTLNWLQWASSQHCLMGLNPHLRGPCGICPKGCESSPGMHHPHGSRSHTRFHTVWPWGFLPPWQVGAGIGGLSVGSVSDSHWGDLICQLLGLVRSTSTTTKAIPDNRLGTLVCGVWYDSSQPWIFL
mmetsp:Transcript_11035/g.19746  ORF Transcript_11035/g.19746 Transcript_11035/m.19746 type:complete len:219 (+) Transcript_11035:586-1242(+)